MIFHILKLHLKSWKSNLAKYEPHLSSTVLLTEDMFLANKMADGDIEEERRKLI